MAKDLAYLRAQTRTYLDEVVAADWSDDEVDREINSGYHEVVTAVVEVYDDFYVDSVLFDTVLGQQEYGVTDGLPSNLFKVRRIELNYAPSTTTSRNRVRPVQLDQVLTDLENTNPPISAVHAPVYYVIGGGSPDYKIGFIPIPTENGTDAGKLWFVKEVDELVDSTDPVLIPYVDRFAPLISRYAAAVLLQKGQQEDKSAIAHLQLFQAGLLKMQQQLESRIADDVKTVVDTAGEDVDFSWGF
jgi:hypothetical protein